MVVSGSEFNIPKYFNCFVAQIALICFQDGLGTHAEGKCHKKMIKVIKFSHSPWNFILHSPETNLQFGTTRKWYDHFSFSPLASTGLEFWHLYRVINFRYGPSTEKGGLQGYGWLTVFRQVQLSFSCLENLGRKNKSLRLSLWKPAFGSGDFPPGKAMKIYVGEKGTTSWSNPARGALKSRN